MAYVVADGEKIYPGLRDEETRQDTFTDKRSNGLPSTNEMDTKDRPASETNNNRSSTTERNRSTSGKTDEISKTEKAVKKLSENIIYWRNPIKTGLVFGCIMSYLLCLSIFPAISVLAYTGLIIILAMMAFRLFVTIKAFNHKTDKEHPFKPYLEKNLKVQSNRIHQQVDSVSKNVQTFFDHLQGVLLVENFFGTLKFAIFLWALTYIGAYLSTLSFVMIGVLATFTLPKIYESYKPQIDHNITIFQSKMRHAEEFLHEKFHHMKKNVQHDHTN